MPIEVFMGRRIVRHSPKRVGGKPFSRRKAKEILSEDEPTLHGKPITKKQRGLLGLIAGGRKPSRRKGYRG